MIILIISLVMTASASLYALHLVELENAKVRHESRNIDETSGFANL